MTMTEDIYTTSAAPAVRPRPFGLFSVATPEASTDPHWMVGVQWESNACVPIYATTDACITGTVPPSKTITPCDADFISIKPFSVYTYVKRTGENADQASNVAATLLSQGEQFGAEAALWTHLSNSITEVAAATTLEALARSEADLAENYHGLGVIHMNAAAATRVGDKLVISGSSLTTKIGTPVVVGAGYNQDDPGAIYATGALVVRRDTVQTYPSNALSTNDLFVLAERTYLVGWDCYASGHSITAP